MSRVAATETRPHETAPTGRARTRRTGRRILTRSVAAGALAFAAVAGVAGTGNATESVTTATVTPVAASTAAAEYWGGIAFSRRTGRTGVTWDYPTSTAASRGATRYCGAGDCRTLVVVRSGCAALAQASDLSLGWAAAPSLGSAESRAIGATPGRGARIIAWTCTAGHR